MGDFFGGMGGDGGGGGGGDFSGGDTSGGTGDTGMGDGSGGDGGGGSGSPFDQNAYDTGMGGGASGGSAPFSTPGTGSSPAATVQQAQMQSPQTPGGTSPTGQQSGQTNMLSQISQLLFGSPANAAPATPTSTSGGANNAPTATTGTSDQLGRVTSAPIQSLDPERPSGPSSAPGDQPNTPFTQRFGNWGQTPEGASAPAGPMTAAPPTWQGAPSIQTLAAQGTDASGLMPGAVPTTPPNAMPSAPDTAQAAATAMPKLGGATGSWGDEPPGVAAASTGDQATATPPTRQPYPESAWDQPPAPTSTAKPGDQTPAQQAGYQDTSAPQGGQQGQQGQQDQQGGQTQGGQQRGQGQGQQQMPNIGRIIQDLMTGNLQDLIKQLTGQGGGQGGQPWQGSPQAPASWGPPPRSPQDPRWGHNPPGTSSNATTPPQSAPAAGKPQAANAQGAQGAQPAGPGASNEPTFPNEIPRGGQPAAAGIPTAPPADVGGAAGTPQGGPQAGASAAPAATGAPIGTATPAMVGPAVVNRTRMAGSDTRPTTGYSDYLRQQRAPQARELQNPRVREQVAGMLITENARDPIGPAESLMNRTSMLRDMGHNGSITRMLHSGFYGPINRGQLNNAIMQYRNNPTLRTRMDNAIDTALSGSNVIAGATDQGLPTDPNGRNPSGRVQRGSEIYNDWGGVRGSANWRRQQQRSVTGGTPQAQAATGTQVAGNTAPRAAPGAAEASPNFADPTANEAAQRNRWQQRTTPGGTDPGVVPAVGGWSNMFSPPTFQDRWEGAPYNPMEELYQQLQGQDRIG